MRKNLQNKILISLLAAGSISVLGFVNAASAAEIVWNNYYTGNDSNGILEITEDNIEFQNKNIAGRLVEEAESNTEYTNNQVTVSAGTFNGRIVGVWVQRKGTEMPSNVKIHDNKVIITNPDGNTYLNSNIYDITGAYESNFSNSTGVELYENSVYIDGITSDSIGAIVGAHGTNVHNNKVTIKDSDITITYDIITGGKATFGNKNESANSN